MKVLLHICCAPCTIGSIDFLKNSNINITGYWLNPNIHPYTEYMSRLRSLEDYSKKCDLNVIYNDVYGLREFVLNVSKNIDYRCEYCYKYRLDSTAKYASENGFEAFSTTLLTSPFQNHDLIVKIAKEIAEKYSVKFLHHDFGENFTNSQREARENGVYMQKYCGCIFSEEERYLKSIN